MGDRLEPTDRLPQRQAVWYRRQPPASSDALAAVRLSRNFLRAGPDTESMNIREAAIGTPQRGSVRDIGPTSAKNITDCGSGGHRTFAPGLLLLTKSNICRDTIAMAKKFNRKLSR